MNHRDPRLDPPAPSRFLNPELVADRLWDRIAELPVPQTDPERGENFHRIFFAIREELGAVYTTIGLRPRTGTYGELRKSSRATR